MTPLHRAPGSATLHIAKTWPAENMPERFDCFDIFDILMGENHTSLGMATLIDPADQGKARAGNPAVAPAAAVESALKNRRGCQSAADFPVCSPDLRAKCLKRLDGDVAERLKAAVC